MKKLQEFKYKDYPTAEARALFVVAMRGYGSIQGLAADIGTSKAYISSTVFIKGLPAKYAGYLGRKFKFNPALLNYESYLELIDLPQNADGYLNLFEDGPRGFFTDDDYDYVLGGSHIKDPVKWLRIHDREINKKAVAKRLEGE